MIFTDKKKSFVLHCDYRDRFLKMSMEERGELITAIFDYTVEGTPPSGLSDRADMAFDFIKAQLDRDLEKYDKRCKANRENIRKRYSGSSTEYNGIPSYTTVTDNDNDSDSVNENENANDTDTDTDTDNDVRGADARQEEAAEVCERDFMEFWREYPKHAAKAEARSAYFAEVHTSEEHSELIELLKQWKDCEDWKKEGGRWIKKAENFIRDIFPTRDPPPVQEQSSSFDTDEFFAAALRRSYAMCDDI